MPPKYFAVLVAVAAAFLLSGCVEKSEVYCTGDADCACGTHVDTGECFVGNREFVDVSKQCPDFCTGIAGNLETKCVENKCSTVQTPYVDSSEFLENVECDALHKCPQGFECAKFPGTGLACYPEEKEPCNLVSCPPGKECVIAESYPVQVFCS